MRDQSKLYQFKSVLRWVGVPLLLAGLISWSVAPAYPAHAQQAEAAKQTGKADKADGSKPASNEELQKLNEKLEKLEEATKQNYLLALDGERKQVDWWLTLLGVLAAIMAVAGGLIPYLMARKDKEIIEQDKVQIKAMLDEIKGMKDDAAGTIERMHEQEAALKKFRSGESEAEASKAQETAAKVEQDKTADPVLRLRAEAISASKPESAEKAFKLWTALTVLAEKDESAQLNAGYWSLMLGKQAKGQEKLRLLRLAGQHYAQVLFINPNSYWGANNWGNALDDEANALCGSDLPVARALWKQAGEKYQQALALKPDAHEIASNFGVALLHEAAAVALQDAEGAKDLQEQAERLLLAHVDAAPGLISYNLACVYGLRGDVQSCLKWLRVAQEQKTLVSCEHLRDDKDLDLVRNDPAFIEWFQQVCPS